MFVGKKVDFLHQGELFLHSAFFVCDQFEETHCSQGCVSGNYGWNLFL